jgi:NAD(P)-dependent dehydrogenase (short-subunit alcohol dehydrogenase family)
MHSIGRHHGLAKPDNAASAKECQDMDTGLSDRVVLVTGASSGIGAATAAAFGSEGARVAISYRNNLAGAEATAERVEAAGGTALIVALDLEAPASIGASVDRVLKHWGQVDVLVGNAVYWGADRPDPTNRFEDVPLAKWQVMLNANVVGNAAVIRAVLPAMRARRWGRIVLISSGAAEEGLPGPGPYGTAKSALHGLARSLAWDAGRDGVLVNVVAAGFTLTDRRWQPAKDLLATLAARTPSQRLSTPQDVAKLIVFLGSAANANLTGELLREGSSAGRSGHVP